MQIHREMLSASIRTYLVEHSGNLILLEFCTTERKPIRGKFKKKKTFQKGNNIFWVEPVSGG